MINSPEQALLDKKNVSYTEYNIRENLEKREEMFKKSNGARTIPQIFIGDLDQKMKFTFDM